jgi:CRISPR/Cas system-associated endoribonuclease Cas2
MLYLTTYDVADDRRREDVGRNWTGSRWQRHVTLVGLRLS